MTNQPQPNNNPTSPQTVVIKFGGNALSAETLSKFTQAVQQLIEQFPHISPVIIHGGGPQINQMLEALALPSKFVNGLRYTDKDTLAVAEMVLSGQVNKQLVSAFNLKQRNAVGISGKDGPTLWATRLNQSSDGESIDLGFVGKVSHVNTALLTHLLAAKFIPIISPLGQGTDGETYNINADDAAAAIAKALNAAHFILMSNIPGLLDQKQNIIHQINKDQALDLIATGVISGGMIPKIHAAIDCLDTVEKVHIIDGRTPDKLAALIAGEAIGTTISQSL